VYNCKDIGDSDGEDSDTCFWRKDTIQFIGKQRQFDGVFVHTIEDGDILAKYGNTEVYVFFCEPCGDVDDREHALARYDAPEASAVQN